jgi:hypothetical protein
MDNRYNTQQNMVAPGRTSAAMVRTMSPEETALLQVPQPAPIQAPVLPQATHSGHLRENFDIVATAKVAERFIIWDMCIFGAVTAAVSFLIWYQVGGDVTIYSLGWLVAWGSVSYFAMHRNRGQAYDHSPTGVARLEQRSQVAMHDRAAGVQEYEIDSRERIALHAIDRHADLIEKRWRLDGGEHDA